MMMEKVARAKGNNQSFNAPRSINTEIKKAHYHRSNAEYGEEIGKK